VELIELSDRLGHRFDRLELLDLALAHRSWCAENGDAPSNERLEFLGDAVLGFAIAEIAFHRFGELAEGRLTDLRKSVVNELALASVATELGIGPFIKLGNGEAAAGGAEKASILSDVFEAVLGAVYLDGGVDAAFRLVMNTVALRLDAAIDAFEQLDFKTSLQELCSRQCRSMPVYSVTSTGPDHAKLFTASVSIDGAVRGAGTGGSKKAAEQAAATVACADLSQDSRGLLGDA
jgi:ribonuclease III